MGLPGSGKTFLAERLKNKLQNHFTVDWFNADIIRKEHNDWDFSEEGRIRQSHRMLAYSEKSLSDIVILDLVAPLERMRDILDCNYVIWMDTISKGRFEDTNSIFTPPKKYNLRITNKDSEYWSSYVTNIMLDYQP